LSSTSLSTHGLSIRACIVAGQTTPSFLIDVQLLDSIPQDCRAAGSRRLAPLSSRAAWKVSCQRRGRPCHDFPSFNVGSWRPGSLETRKARLSCCTPDSRDPAVPLMTL
jgi:hypothetical protein